MVNTGAITKAQGTGETIVQPALSQSGTLNVDTGRLKTDNLQDYSAASKTLAGGTYNLTGTLALPNADVVTNAATLALKGSGAQVDNSSTGAADDGLDNLRSNAASGHVRVLDGKSLTAPKASSPGPFTNTGTLTVGDASTFTATGGLQNNGTLQGSGTVARGGGGTPTVTNAGTVRPGSSPGRLTVSGDYTQTAAGTLVTEVEGSSPGSSLDQLAVSGTATLGGTLDIQNDFSPSPGDSFTILTYGARSGEFATINGLGIDPDHEHLPLYEADRMRLVVTKSAFSDLSIEQSAQATEGDSATHDAEVAVSLSAPTRRTVNVDYATSDGTAGQPGDYTATSGRLTFAPGDEVKKIKVPVRADVLDEGDEQLDVTLSEPGGGTPVNATMPADKTGTLTLVDDDPEPAVSIRDEVFVEEGDTADVTALVPVRLSAPSGRRVTVAYATEAASATAGDDYETTTGTLTFDPGDPTVKTIAVPIRGDTLDEPAEPLTLRLSAPSNASLDPSVADSTIRIVDQDPPRPPSATPSLSVDDVRVAEGNTGENRARLRLQLSESTDQAVTASYSTADVTAQAPTDYDAESGTVTFSPGERTAVVDVPVNGDKTDESDEAFDLNLPNVSSNATLGDSSGRVTIVDDDDEIPPETTITSGALRDRPLHDRERRLQVLGARGRIVRMSSRRGLLVCLRLAGGLFRLGPGRSHLRGPCHRRRGHRRSYAGQAQLDRRHLGSQGHGRESLLRREEGRPRRERAGHVLRGHADEHDHQGDRHAGPQGNDAACRGEGQLLARPPSAQRWTHRRASPAAPPTPRRSRPGPRTSQATRSPPGRPGRSRSSVESRRGRETRDRRRRCHPGQHRERCGDRAGADGRRR